MQNNIELKKEFRRGTRLRDQRKYSEAITCFNELVRNPSFSDESYKFHLVLGGIYNELKMYEKALRSFTICLSKKTNCELASLGKYIAFVKLEQYDNALKEVINFLKYYPANLYLDTLEELKVEIKEGHINNPEFIKSIQVIFLKYNMA